MHRAIVCPFFLVAGIVIALAACSGNDQAGNTDAQAMAGADSPLPKPEPTTGSVTGMPDKPGPRVIGVPPGLGPDAAVALVTAENTGDAIDPETGAAPTNDDGSAGSNPTPSPSAEPTPENAVGVLREYYAAIDAHDFAHAWALWSDNGRASGQTPQQFADGFANTAHVAVSTGTPGMVEGAAGSRYIQIPISIEAAQRDGSVRRYAGAYTLRRAVADGATAGQRSWTLASANLNEVRQ